MAYSCVIVGAGNIAGGYDNPSGEAVLTHAHAISKHPDLILKGFYDCDTNKAIAAAKKWDCDVIDDFQKIMSADVIAVCVPDAYHLEVVRNLLSFKPKLIVLEKPIADTIENSEELLSICSDVAIAVNYSRRYVKTFQDLARAIALKDFGTFQIGSGYYCKGFIHNASHMLDLLRMLIGEIDGIQVLSKDGGDIDCQVNVEDSGKFIIQHLPNRNYTIFELDLLFTGGRIQILDSGNKLIISKPKCSSIYAGYSYLEHVETIQTDLPMAMYNLYINVVDFLEKRTDLILPLNQAFMRGLYV